MCLYREVSLSLFLRIFAQSKAGYWLIISNHWHGLLVHFLLLLQLGQLPIISFASESVAFVICVPHFDPFNLNLMSSWKYTHISAIYFMDAFKCICSWNFWPNPSFNLSVVYIFPLLFTFLLLNYSIWLQHN